MRKKDRNIQRYNRCRKARSVQEILAFLLHKISIKFNKGEAKCRKKDWGF